MENENLEDKIYFVVKIYEYLGFHRASEELWAGKLDNTGIFVTYRKIGKNKWEGLMEWPINNTIVDAEPEYINRDKFIKLAKKIGLSYKQIVDLIEHKPDNSLEEYGRAILEITKKK